MINVKKSYNNKSSNRLIYFIKNDLFVSKIVLLFIVSISMISIYRIDSRFNNKIQSFVFDATMHTMNVSYYIPNTIKYILLQFTEYYNIKHKYDTIMREYKLLDPHLIEKLESENKKLYALLDFIEDNQIKSHITTKLVTSSKNKFGKSAFIALGTNNGIQNDQAVVNENGLIGKIVNATESSARIMFITDINFRATVITEETNQKSIIYGSDDYLLKLKYLNESVKLRIGEKVLTTGNSPNFAPGLLIGRVVSNYEVKPEFNWSGIEFVTIVM